MLNDHCIKESLIKKQKYNNSKSVNYGIKNQILELCNDIPIQSQENLELAYEVNIDFVWCLENLIYSPKMQNIVFLKKDSNGEFEFVKRTLCLQKQGLPNGYYVVAKNEQYFLCGHVESPRLYLFSTSLGITNTKYSNIFEYIRERLQN